jgi:hypothetical protein
MSSKGVAEIFDAGHIFEPQVHPHGDFVKFVAFVHGDVIITRDHLGCRQPVGRDHGGLVKITVRADMIAVLVGANHQIDVSDFEPDSKKPSFQHWKILVGTGIDHHVLVISLDDIAVTATVRTSDLKNSRLEFDYLRIALHCLTPFTLHGRFEITVDLKLFRKAVIFKIAFQAWTQITEAKNPSALIHFLLEGSKKSHFPHSQLREFLQIDNDPDTLLGEPPIEKILHP